MAYTESSNNISEELKQLSGWPFDGLGGYSLGYLFTKLPDSTYVRKNIQSPKKHGGNYRGKYTCAIDRGLANNHIAYGDTAENAATKLCIYLFKQGILSSTESNKEGVEV